MRLSRFVIAGVLFLGMALVGTAGDNAKNIVGVWKLTKTEGLMPLGTTAEFTKAGKLTITVKGKDDKDTTFDASYKVKADKLTITTKSGEKEVANTETIKKLTDKELITEDDKGKVTEFKRGK